MATIKKATKAKWLRTKCVVPLAKDRKSDFTFQSIQWKKNKDGKPIEWLLSISLGMSDDPLMQEALKRDVLWTHGIPADPKKPSTISGIFCPATFVMRDGNRQIEFTLDQLNQSSSEVGIVQLAFRLVKHPSDGSYAPVPAFAFEDWSGFKKVEQKALSMVRVIGEALPPFTEGIKQKDWVYRITDFVRGDANDVKPLKAGKEFVHAFNSEEALNQLEKVLKPEDYLPRVTELRKRQLMDITGRSHSVIRSQLKLIRQRKETK
jgi:hypothetical protein